MIADAERFGQRVRGLFRLALPIIGAMLSQNLLNLVDTAMVGRLGSSALAAVGLGSMVNWFAAAFFMGLGSGVQAIAARRIGEGDSRGAVGSLHCALAIAVVLVLPYSLVLARNAVHIFTLLSSDRNVLAQGVPYLAVRLCAATFVIANFSFRGYWNGVGKSAVYLRTILVIHGINIFLNWVLIYGHLGAPPLGVLGAGIASAIAVGIGSITHALLAWRYVGKHGFLARGTWQPGTLRSVLRLSIPAGVQNIFLSAGFVAFYRIAQLLGTRELAVSNVLINLSMVCLLPSLGYGLASATMVGASLGKGEPRNASRWAWTAVLVASATMVVPGALLSALPRLWLTLLINDPVAVLMGIAPLIMLGAMQPLDAVGLVLSHALIGAGATRAVMISTVALQWGLFLPVVYIWATHYGGKLLALWIALVLWRALYAVLMAALFMRGRWASIEI